MEMENSVLSSLLRINRQRMLALRHVLVPYQYVGVMHLIVAYTARNPGASQEEIACFYALDKTSVARDAKRLEEMGHIRREFAPDNRRQYQLFLTDGGREMAAVLQRFYEDFHRRLSAGIPAGDWEALELLLKRLEANSRLDM